MSTFIRQPVACPRCGVVGDHEVATSVNAGRSPALRDAVLAERFQVLTCDACGHAFSYLGEFVYLDFDRSQMIGVFPSSSERSWPHCERQTLDAYEPNLGRSAPAVARPFGDGMAVRCVFGLGALREKLVLADAGLDDVAVEAAKLDLLRSLAGPALAPRQRLRLVEAGTDEVAFALSPAAEDPDQRPSRLPVSRAALVGYLAAASADERLMGILGAGPYVDLGRLLIAPEPAPSHP